MDGAGEENQYNDRLSLFRRKDAEPHGRCHWVLHGMRIHRQKLVRARSHFFDDRDRTRLRFGAWLVRSPAAITWAPWGSIGAGCWWFPSGDDQRATGWVLYPSRGSRQHPSGSRRRLADGVVPATSMSTGRPPQLRLHGSVTVSLRLTHESERALDDVLSVSSPVDGESKRCAAPRFGGVVNSADEMLASVSAIRATAQVSPR